MTIGFKSDIITSMSKEKLVVVNAPAGRFVTSLTVPLSERASKVTLVFRSKEGHQQFQISHENKKWFPGRRLPENVYSTDDEGLPGTIAEADVLIIVPPARVFRGYYQSIYPYIERSRFAKEGFIVIGSKGLEEGTDLRMSEIVK